MPEEAPGATGEEAVAGSAAVRSYLNATLTPVLLKALMKMEDEQPNRPILWLAEYLENYSDI